MESFSKEVRAHLENCIIPFWESLRDEEYGGYYGFMDYNLKIVKDYTKGCILNSRILWFFSNSYTLLKDEKLRMHARHAYDFLKKSCLDSHYGGLYWSVTYAGQIEDATKHTYNQAFAIYALSSYYECSGDSEALVLAETIYELIENKCRDEQGYLEAFDRRFLPQENEKLSENGVIAERTMNTLLHVFEAYTELYRVSKKERVAVKLKEILNTISGKVYNYEIGRQEVFFDRAWNSLIDLYSYGHDIEAAWLIDRGVAVLNDPVYEEKMFPITKEITNNIYNRAYKNHSLLNEKEYDRTDQSRVWWVQAEAVVGFINGYQKEPEEERYLVAAHDIWKFINTKLIDTRNGSEWFWAVGDDGRPLEKPLVEPWKCPYHNGRMCLEVIRRIENVT